MATTPSVADEPGLWQTASDQSRKALPPVDLRLAGRVRQDLGDDVRVALGGQPLDEIPATPERAQAQCPDRDATDKQRQRELRTNVGRNDRKREHERPEAEILPALATQ